MSNKDLPKGIQGKCRWCGLPIEGKRRKFWDADCKRQFLLAIGRQIPPVGRIIYSVPLVCAKCGGPCWYGSRSADGAEIEHALALSVAKRGGYKTVIASFLLENIRWLCSDCHRIKTTAERRIGAMVDRLEPWEPGPAPTGMDLATRWNVHIRPIMLKQYPDRMMPLF